MMRPEPSREFADRVILHEVDFEGVDLFGGRGVLRFYLAAEFAAVEYWFVGAAGDGFQAIEVGFGGVVAAHYLYRLSALSP